MERTLKSAVVFLFAAMLSVDAATVSGVVKDSAGGAPLSGIYVSLRLPTITLARDTTGADGAYSLTTDSVGAFIVRARDLATDPNYPQKDSNVTLTASDAKTINILLAKIPKSSVSGILKADSANGALISGAIVTLRSGAAIMGRIDTTGADGKFQIDNVTMGNYFLSATAAGFVTNNVSDTIKIATTEPVVKNITLTSIVYSGVSGVISDDAATSAPIAGAVVVLRSATFGGAASRRDTTGDDGKYQFDSVSTGNYVLSVTAVKFVPLTVSDTVKLTTSAPAVKNIKMTAIVYVVISGTVGDDAATSAPIAGAIVTLREPGMGGPGVGARRDTTGADGVFQFDSVESGNYVLSVTATKYLPPALSDTIKVTSSQPITRKIIMKLIVYSSIGGTVKDAANAPLSKAIVTIRQTTAASYTARRDTTADGGNFSFDSVLTGKYVVTVTAVNFFSKIDTHEVTATPLSLAIQLLPVVFAKISGLVTDSVGKPISGALVLFSRSGTTLTRNATTGSDGKYTLDSVTTGTLSVIVNGLAKIVPLSITSPSAQTVDISYKTSGISIVAEGVVRGLPMIGFGSNGCLRLNNFIGAGIVRLYDASGRQVFMQRIAAFHAQQELPLLRRMASGNYTITVEHEKSSFRGRILIP